MMWMVSMIYGALLLVLMKPFKEDKSELMKAFLAFIVSIMVANIFIGIGFFNKSIIFAFLGTFAIFTGSAFMLKFPISAFPDHYRKSLFYLSIIAFYAIIAWLMISASGRAVMPRFSIWFMVIVNGFITGLYMIYVGLQSQERWLRVKATGGGLGVAACCLASHIMFSTELVSLLVMGAMFGIASPFIMLYSVIAGRRLQNQAGNVINKIV